MHVKLYIPHFVLQIKMVHFGTYVFFGFLVCVAWFVGACVCCLCVCLCVFVCMCVCVKESERWRERERENVCECECECVCVSYIRSHSQCTFAREL